MDNGFNRKARSSWASHHPRATPRHGLLSTEAVGPTPYGSILTVVEEAVARRFPADAHGVSPTPWGWLLPSTPGQFIAHVCRQRIDPGLLAPRFRQDMAELDHVGVSEVVQIHPNHRFGNVKHPHEEISNSDQDVVLGGAVRSARM